MIGTKDRTFHEYSDSIGKERTARSFIPFGKLVLGTILHFIFIINAVERRRENERDRKKEREREQERVWRVISNGRKRKRRRGRSRKRASRCVRKGC